jgi:hypothetical protein
MIVKEFSPLLLWVLYQNPIDVVQEVPCLSFYGSSSSGKANFFGTSDTACAVLASERFIHKQPIRVERDGTELSQLVWLEYDSDAFDPSIAFGARNHFGHVYDQIFGIQSGNGYEGQQVIQSDTRRAQLLHSGEQEAMVRMERSAAETVDLRLPRFWKSMSLPEMPIPLRPVSDEAVKRVQRLLDSISYDPTIASLVDSLSVSQMKKDIEYLTGEDPESPIISRHSFSAGVRTAAHWLKDRFEETGASCELKPFLAGFGPNVIWWVQQHYLAATSDFCSELAHIPLSCPLTRLF